MGEKERDRALKYLTIQLGNVYGAMGIAGNICCEGGVNFEGKRVEIAWTKKTGWTDDTYAPAVNNGTYRKYLIINGNRELQTFMNTEARGAFATDQIGFGIVQWTYSNRKYNMFDFCTRWCKERNKCFDISNLDMQLDFILCEMATDFKKLYGKLYSCTDIATASNLVCVEYEKPHGYDSYEQQKKRQDMSYTMYEIGFKSKDTQWFELDDKWYYLDHGYIIRNKWFEFEGDWYHFNSKGEMETCVWIDYDNEWYYLGKNGKSTKNEWVKYNNDWYYVADDQVMAHDCLLLIDGKNYRFDKNGKAKEV